ncbi:MAG: hypothetical protein IJ157_08555 [Clostridia bacterium]|nr:hypothetical protein [Clostridia bacterium]
MKKLIAIMLTLIMTLSLATAFATSSITASDVAEVVVEPTAAPAATTAAAVEEVEEEPVEEEEELVVAIIAETEEQTAELEKIEEFIKEAPLAEYFAEEEFAEELADKDLQLDEMVPMLIENYEPEMGELTLTVKFDTVYEEDDPIYVLVALFDEEGNVNWVLIDAENVTVTADGSLSIKFPTELLEQMSAAASVSLAVLSEKPAI